MTTPADDGIRRTYQATLDDLYGFLLRRCGGDRNLAEDVTQEVWLRAVRAWADDGIPNRPLAWLHTVAGRLLLNHFRRPDVSRLDRDALDGLGAPDADAGRAATARRSPLTWSPAFHKPPAARPAAACACSRRRRCGRSSHSSRFAPRVGCGMASR